MNEPYQVIHGVEKALEPRHREAMLDLILAWAAIDGALGWFLSGVHGFTPADGAELISRMSAAQIIADARKALRGRPGGDEIAASLKRHKRAYEAHSQPRNRIAHAKCVGSLLADPDRIVFAIFEREGDGLAMETIHIDTIRAAARWACAFAALALKAGDYLLV